MNSDGGWCDTYRHLWEAMMFHHALQVVQPGFVPCWHTNNCGEVWCLGHMLQ